MNYIELNKDITKITDTAYKRIKELLMGAFPNLYFYISPTGALTCWIKDSRGLDGIGVEFKHPINVGAILYHNWEYLENLNNQVQPIIDNPQKYFWCTECSQVKLIEDLVERVFAGCYCTECAKKPEIKSLIEESHKRGFYD